MMYIYIFCYSFNSTEEFRATEELGFAVPSEDEDYQTGFLKKGKVSRASLYRPFYTLH